MATAALFDASNLNALPNFDGVTADEATAVEAVVWGWLAPLLGVTERPDPVTPQLFSWALELGAIYYANPTGLTSRQLGPYAEKFSAERRDEILQMVESGGTVVAGGPPKPVGSFPSARPYPDPAERCW